MIDMARSIQLSIDGELFSVPCGITIAVALSLTDQAGCRESFTGQWRTPFCGMGICQECRVTIDGLRRPACQTLCRNGMMITRTHS